MNINKFSINDAQVPDVCLAKTCVKCTPQIGGRNETKIVSENGYLLAAVRCYFFRLPFYISGCTFGHCCIIVLRIDIKFFGYRACSNKKKKTRLLVFIGGAALLPSCNNGWSCVSSGINQLRKVCYEQIRPKWIVLLLRFQITIAFAHTAGRICARTLFYGIEGWLKK